MFANLFGKAKKKLVFSLDQLKQLHKTTLENLTVTPSNSDLVVETLRSIAELVIWGDQNDPHIFDYFMEKEMLSYFKHVMCQNVSSQLHVQLLQTITLLFDNLSHPTSIWYLLSNNQMNAIIAHDFDFSNDEVLAYYISVLRTLSLRLNESTIHFFRNEHVPGMPLYTEAIKLFNHRESMVRTAVRTLTLHIFRVRDADLIAYLTSPDAPPYFSNLAWFIGHQSIELDALLRTEADHRGRIADKTAEYQDQLCYLTDILSLGVPSLSSILTHHLVENLMIPLYVYGLGGAMASEKDQLRVKPVLCLWMLGQIFLSLEHAPLVNAVAATLLLGNPDLGADEDAAGRDQAGPADGALAGASVPVVAGQPCFSAPRPLKTLQPVAVLRPAQAASLAASASSAAAALPQASPAAPVPAADASGEDVPVPDAGDAAATEAARNNMGLGSVFMEAIYDVLDCKTTDLTALPALHLLYALVQCRGIQRRILSRARLAEPTAATAREDYNTSLVNQLTTIISDAVHVDAKIRFATVALAARLVAHLTLYTPPPAAPAADGAGAAAAAVEDEEGSVGSASTHTIPSSAASASSLPPTAADDMEGSALAAAAPEPRPAPALRKVSLLSAHHADVLRAAENEAILQLRDFLIGEVERGETQGYNFLDLFEEEVRKGNPLNPGRVGNDPSILLPATANASLGLDFELRLPCDNKERVRKAVQLFLLMRRLGKDIRGESEDQLPLRQPAYPLSIRECLQLTEDSNVIACNVISKGKNGQLSQVRRFMLVDDWRLILIEPDSLQLGRGIIRFVADLHNIVVTTDSSNLRILQVNVYKSSISDKDQLSAVPLFSARLVFDNHIRCVVARQYLENGKHRVREGKIHILASMLGVNPDNLPHYLHTAKAHPPSPHSSMNSAQITQHITSSS